MTEEQPSDSRVEWNMAQLLNMELAKLREQANTAFISGHYRKAIDSLRSMTMTTIFVMSKSERDSLKQFENLFELPLMASKSETSFNPKERVSAKKAILFIRNNLPKYNEKIMDILNNHGFLGNYKRDSGKMKL